MATSHNYGLHNNNLCLQKKDKDIGLAKGKIDIGLGNNLYITIKNCVQGANNKNYVCWKACKGYRVCIIMAQHTIIA